MTLAIVTFVDASNGGRISPPSSGFRPQVAIGGIHASCTIESTEGIGVFQFGRNYRVELNLLHPAEYPAAFNPGDLVKFYEGSKCIGFGEVTDA